MVRRWDKPFGIVDFAFTSPDGAVVNFEEVQKRLEGIEGNEVRYDKPNAGERKRPDRYVLPFTLNLSPVLDADLNSELVKWHTTFPLTTNGFQRGELPFFCHDVTDRALRVPMSKENITHPSFAYGIKDLLIYVPESRISALTKG
jgi:hypothetical protein